MGALIITIFTASLLGSPHCVGMCGAFAALAGGDLQQAGRAPQASLTLAYSLGRLLTYLAMGALAGLAGATLELGGELLGLQRVAAMTAGGVMLGLGIISLLRVLGWRVPGMRAPAWLGRLARRGHRLAAGLRPGPRALAIGMLSTLLPCGWLYAFVISAAGTGSPWLGMLAMAAFWSGTLPLMVSLGLGIRALLGGLAPRLPLLSALAITLVGAYTLAGRLKVVPPTRQAGTAVAVAPTSTPPCCHVNQP
jgi:uncharacterized protein